MFKFNYSISLLMRRYTGQLDEENLSTKYDQQEEDARIFATDEYQGGKAGIEAKTG
jgi:hypothetical protein